MPSHSYVTNPKNGFSLKVLCKINILKVLLNAYPQ